jgi:hypothetical protein
MTTMLGYHLPNGPYRITETNHTDVWTYADVSLACGCVAHTTRSRWIAGAGYSSSVTCFCQAHSADENDDLR